MKLHSLMLVFVLITPLYLVQSQSGRNTYHANISLSDGTKVRGMLASAHEDGLLILKRDLTDTVALVSPETIELIKLRRRGKIGRGALIGAGGGALLGAIIGFVDGDDGPECFLLCYTATEKAGIGALFLTPIGSGIGAVIGTKSDKVVIDGNIDTYKARLSQLQGYALK